MRINTGMDATLGERTPGNIKEAWDLDLQKAEPVWRPATDKELAKIMQYDTLKFVAQSEVPPNTDVIPGVWEFKIKRNPDGSIASYKARWCVDGKRAVYGIHYDDTFSPTVRAASVRALWHKAMSLGVKPYMTDVESAFLNAYLDKAVYVTCPQGYERYDEDGTPMVAMVLKALYGMPQAPRCWHDEVAKRLLKHGFKRSEADPCVFTYCEGDKFMGLGLHVDDFMRVASHPELHDWLHNVVLKGYVCKDEGLADCFLGVQSEWLNDHTVLLHQERYIEDLGKRFSKFLLKKRVKTPMDPAFKLSDDDLADKCTPEEWQIYQEIVGALIYPTTLSAPALAQPITFVSRFMSDPCKKVLKEAVRILTYACQNPRMGYKLNMLRESSPDTGIPITVWSDAAYANQVGSRSTMGQIFTTPYGLLSWRSKTIPGVPLSSTEAEIIALVFAVRELIFLRELFADLHMASEESPPTKIFEDNTASIQIASQVGVSDRTKHMQIKYHFLRHKLEMEVFSLEYLNTKKMLADMLTKPLPGPALYVMLASITRLEMGGAKSGLVVTLGDDDEEYSTESNPDLDSAVEERVKEIQYGGDWRKMKALRQKKLSRQEGATISKRHKKTTKALWRQALVTRSAEAESHSDSQLARTTYDSPADTANTERTMATTVSTDESRLPFPPLKEEAFVELQAAVQKVVLCEQQCNPDNDKECETCPCWPFSTNGKEEEKSRKSKFWKSNESEDSSKVHHRQEAIPTAVPISTREEYKPAHGEDQCWSHPDSKGISEEFRVADQPFPTDSKVPEIVKALGAYVLSQGAQGTPDCRKATMHQTDVSRAFFEVDITEQSQKDDLADQEKDERRSPTLANIQEVAEPREKRSTDGMREKARYAQQKRRRTENIPLSLLF
jgi:hypothetical protein